MPRTNSSTPMCPPCPLVKLSAPVGAHQSAEQCDESFFFFPFLLFLAIFCGSWGKAGLLTHWLVVQMHVQPRPAVLGAETPAAFTPGFLPLGSLCLLEGDCRAGSACFPGSMAYAEAFLWLCYNSCFYIKRYYYIASSVMSKIEVIAGFP